MQGHALAADHIGLADREQGGLRRRPGRARDPEEQQRESRVREVDRSASPIACQSGGRGRERACRRRRQHDPEPREIDRETDDRAGETAQRGDATPRRDQPHRQGQRRADTDRPRGTGVVAPCDRDDVVRECVADDRIGGPEGNGGEQHG